MTTKPTHYPRTITGLVGGGSRFLFQTMCGWSVLEDHVTAFTEEVTCKRCLQVLHKRG